MRIYGEAERVRGKVDCLLKPIRRFDKQACQGRAGPMLRRIGAIIP